MRSIPPTTAAHLKRAVMARVASTAAPSPNWPMEVAYLRSQNERKTRHSATAISAATRSIHKLANGGCIPAKQGEG